MVLIAPFLYLRIVAPLDKMAFWMMIGVTIMVSLQLTFSPSHMSHPCVVIRIFPSSLGDATSLMRPSLWLDTVG
jgi:hypothetical protein